MNNERSRNQDAATSTLVAPHWVEAMQGFMVGGFMVGSLNFLSISVTARFVNQGKHPQALSI